MIFFFIITQTEIGQKVQFILRWCNIYLHYFSFTPYET